MRFPQASPTIEDTLERFWPVGSIFANVSGVNPAVTFGFGTWAAFGAGRAIVGVDASDPDFDAAEKTAGAKTVTLTEAQMPAHTHTQDTHLHAAVTDGGTTVANGGGNAFATVNQSGATGSLATGAATAVNQSTGGGQAHNNVQPSISVYLFKRTA